MVAAPPLQTPAMTIIRLPLVIADAGVIRRVDPSRCAQNLWTNCGAAFGVTEFDAAESGPVPTAFVAETVNV